MSRKACRTRTSSKGLTSMRMVNGRQAPVSALRSASPSVASMTLAWLFGSCDMAWIWPLFSALMRAVSSAYSIMVSVSTYGAPP